MAHRDAVGRGVHSIAYLLDRDRPTGPRFVGRPARLCGASPVAHKLDSYKGIIDARLEAFPKLSAKRLFDEVRAAGYELAGRGLIDVEPSAAGARIIVQVRRGWLVETPPARR